MRRKIDTGQPARCLYVRLDTGRPRVARVRDGSEQRQPPFVIERRASIYSWVIAGYVDALVRAHCGRLITDGNVPKWMRITCDCAGSKAGRSRWTILLRNNQSNPREKHFYQSSTAAKEDEVFLFTATLQLSY